MRKRWPGTRPGWRLGDNKDLVPPPLQSFGNHAFTAAITVARSSINQVNAQFHGASECGERFLVGIRVGRGQLRVGADDVLIGSQLAKDLGVQVGSKLRLDTGQQNSALVNIAGIFELGVRELDARYVYLDLKQAQSLLSLPGGVTVIDLTVADIFEAENIAARVGRLTSLQAESWIKTNAQLMNAISAQSLSTNMIIIFVAISVAFGIASVLSVSVVQRTREIGILRATGATQQQILRIFLFQGALFGLFGSVVGSVASFALVWVFNTFGPGLFYIPISIELVIVALLLATLTGVLAAAIPARRAAALDPVEAIRHV